MVARRALIVILLAALVAVAAIAWRQHDRADQAEAQLGLDAARVLSATFSRASSLKVAQLSGEVTAASESTSGFGMFANRQTTRAPYSVDYSVDLSRLRPDDLRWDEETRIMTIDLPEVTVGAPNIDMARARMAQSGVYISRTAGQSLQKQAASRLAVAAERKAEEPANLARAQAAARAAVERLVATPLQAAGMDGVRVVVRLPGEAKPAGLSEEQWDRSRSLQEVLGNAR